MSDLYKCGTCGVVTEDKSQLCDVEAISGKEEYCNHSESFDQMCSEMEQEAAYVCSSCGQPSDQADLLCSPQLSP